MTQPRALITGIQGFTGRYVQAELEAAGYEVHGLALSATPGLPHIHAADLGDAAALRDLAARLQPQVVVHLAAIAFVAHGDADDFYRVNLIGTRHLLAALAAVPAPPRCVLLASSANVYGNGDAAATAGSADDARVLTESTTPCPVNDYAVSKLAMEHMARLWQDKLRIVVVRPFNYTGIGQAESFLVPKIVGHMRRREPVLELGNLDVWRDFSDVRAVAHAYRRLVETCPAGATVNVCSGRMHSLRDVITMAQAISGHRPEVRVNPAFVRAQEVRALRGDNSHLRTLIGEWSTPPLEDTLRWMLAADASA